MNVFLSFINSIESFFFSFAFILRIRSRRHYAENIIQRIVKVYCWMEFFFIVVEYSRNYRCQWINICYDSQFEVHIFIYVLIFLYFHCECPINTITLSGQPHRIMEIWSYINRRYCFVIDTIVLDNHLLTIFIFQNVIESRAIIADSRCAIKRQK